MRLYHQSSKEASEILKGHSNVPEAEHITKLDKLHHSDETIAKNGLRLLWDSLESLDILRSNLLLNYLKKSGLINSKSLEYFEFRLAAKCFEIVSQERDENECHIITSAFCAITNHLIIEHLKTGFSDETSYVLNVIINMHANMKMLTPIPCDSVHFFFETDSNFCEFSQLKDIDQLIPDFKALKDRMEVLKLAIRDICTEYLKTFLENNQSIDCTLLEKLDLDAKFTDDIAKKMNEVKLKGSSEKLKSDLSDFFDRLMKSIQASIRSNVCFMDETLKTKFKVICNSLEESKLLKRTDFIALIRSFSQTITNKSNIIFTIHRNELAARNKTSSIPLPSNIYLGVKLCHNLIEKLLECDNDLVIALGEELRLMVSNNFLKTWLNDIASVYEKIKFDINEFFALIWLSDCFTTLQIPINHKETVIDHLGIDINRIKTQFSTQAALLAGILQPSQQIPTPKLQSSNLTNSSVDLLQHFIPQ